MQVWQPSATLAESWTARRLGEALHLILCLFPVKNIIHRCLFHLSLQMPESSEVCFSPWRQAYPCPRHSLHRAWATSVWSATVMPSSPNALGFPYEKPITTPCGYRHSFDLILRQTGNGRLPRSYKGLSLSYASCECRGVTHIRCSDRSPS